MVEKATPKELDHVQILASVIKTQVETFLQSPHTFQEQKRKSRSINLDPQALSRFIALPVNLAQVIDVKMLVVITDAGNTTLTLERDGQEVDKFKHTNPQTTFVYLNFKDKQKPHTTFVFSLEFGEGQPSGAYITLINPNVDNELARKPSYRKNVASDFTAVRDLLINLNGKQMQTSS